MVPSAGDMADCAAVAIACAVVAAACVGIGVAAAIVYQVRWWWCMRAARKNFTQKKRGKNRYKR